MKGAAHYQTLEYRCVERLFRTFAAEAGRRLRVLDFGCGRGKYLRCFAELGLDVVGVDLNRAYVEEGQSAGFTVYHGEELFAAGEPDFDVVFLSHIIEHLPPAELVLLVPRLCSLVRAGGRLIIITPLLGERFFHDFSHIRPYYPQSIRHAFGQLGSELSYGNEAMIELVDIYFFKDPYRTRTWRSFYGKTGFAALATRLVNRMFDACWRLTGGALGAKASWLGVYEVQRPPPPAG